MCLICISNKSVLFYRLTNHLLTVLTIISDDADDLLSVISFHVKLLTLFHLILQEVAVEILANSSKFAYLRKTISTNFSRFNICLNFYRPSKSNKRRHLLLISGSEWLF